MKKKIEILKGLEDVTEFVKIVLHSNNIHGEKPLSLVLRAPVSSGKTITVKQFIKNKNILITTDTTAYGIIKKYQNDLREGKIRHIIIPDLLNVLSRRETTVKSFLLFVNATSEDGIFPSKTYGFEVREFIRPFGWIMCLTEEGYQQKKRYLQGIGFTSRFFILKYCYSEEQINAIIERIIKEDIFKIAELKVKSHNKRAKIIGNAKIFKELKFITEMLTKGAEKIRMQRKLQTFLKASAYTRGSEKVEEIDLKKLKKLLYLVKDA